MYYNGAASVTGEYLIQNGIGISSSVKYYITVKGGAGGPNGYGYNDGNKSGQNGQE